MRGSSTRGSTTIDGVPLDVAAGRISRHCGPDEWKFGGGES